MLSRAAFPRMCLRSIKQLPYGKQVCSPGKGWRDLAQSERKLNFKTLKETKRQVINHNQLMSSMGLATDEMDSRKGWLP